MRMQSLRGTISRTGPTESTSRIQVIGVCSRRKNKIVAQGVEKMKHMSRHTRTRHMERILKAGHAKVRLMRVSTCPKKGVKVKEHSA